MNRGQGRKEVREVAAKINEDGFVSVQAEKLADDLPDQHFAISQTRLWVTLTQRLLRKEGVKSVVN